MQVEGQREECLHSLPATGARVSNTYATYPNQGDNPAKAGLIPRIFREASLWKERLRPDGDGHAAH